MPVKIVRLAARGDGVSEDGRFVAFAAPGDTLAADGAVIAGPHHQSPPCRHFPGCGGCQLQHVDDDAYRAYLTARIIDALAAQGIGDVMVAPPHLSPPYARRRATLHAERRGKGVVIGYNAAASHDIVDLTECRVLHPTLFALVLPLRALLAPILKGRARARITMTLADQGVDLGLAGVEADGLAAIEALTTFGAENRLARLSLDEGFGSAVRYQPGDVTVTLSGQPVALPEGAFLQATADGEAALIGAVRDAVAGAATAVDLFAGLGTFALALDGKVLAVEGARDAIMALGATRRVAIEHRDLFRRPLTKAELARFGAVVLDPPRAGAKEQVAEICHARPPRIAYVSCNPATFARDAHMLVEAGYRLTSVLPVGQFRWSTHVELVAAFAR